jgi:hypothetical protein
VGAGTRTANAAAAGGSIKHIPRGRGVQVEGTWFETALEEELKALIMSGTLGSRTKAKPLCFESRVTEIVSLSGDARTFPVLMTCERILIDGGCTLLSCSCSGRANRPGGDGLEQTGVVRLFRNDAGMGPTKISGLFPCTLQAVGGGHREKSE